jgi:hypothetical protein
MTIYLLQKLLKDPGHRRIFYRTNGRNLACRAKCHAGMLGWKSPDMILFSFYKFTIAMIRQIIHNFLEE